jgi:hypothetical protein
MSGGVLLRPAAADVVNRDKNQNKSTKFTEGHEDAESWTRASFVPVLIFVP